MTNTEMWLDETISHIKSIKSDIWMLHEIMSLPNCNDCKNKDCEYKPKWGEHIRYNCPLHNADRKTENSSEIPTNYCDDCLYTDTCDSKEFFYACTSKATISKMEQVDKDINVRSKDEPQINPCDGCVCDDGKHLMYCMNCKGIAWKTEPPKVEDEPQTDCAWR